METSPPPGRAAPSTISSSLPSTPLEDPALALLPAQSATLRSGVALVRADHFSVQWGRAGGGTYYDEINDRIIIDSNSMGDGKKLAKSLSHEIGHHKFQGAED